MRIRDLLQGDDGKLSQAKLAGATGHLLFALAFLKQQVLGEPSFNEAAWWVYGSFAVGHPVANKALDLVRQVKEKTNETKVEIAKTTGLPPDIQGGNAGSVITTTKTQVEQ